MSILAIEIATLNLEDLKRLCQKAKIIINTIGPYHLYSTPVVEACALTGTHYVDVTGESPWEYEMMRRFQDPALENKAIIIPGMGIESAISDMLTYAMAKSIREKYDVGIGKVTTCVHDVSGGPSGGTLLTILTVLDTYGISGIAAASKAFAMSPVPGPRNKAQESLTTKFTGVRTVANLGMLTSSISASVNKAIVERSWGLLDKGKFYGPKFSFSEYMRVSNMFSGIAFHYLFLSFGLLLLLPPVRWLAKKLVTSPGQGPSKQAMAKEFLEYRAVAVADQPKTNPAQAISRFRYEGGMYYLTAILLVEGAMAILEDPSLIDRYGGGFLTPATLGQPYIDRMRKGGITFETSMI